MRKAYPAKASHIHRHSAVVGIKSAAEEKIPVFEKADDDISISDVGGDQHQTSLGSRIRSPER